MRKWPTSLGFSHLFVVFFCLSFSFFSFLFAAVIDLSWPVTHGMGVNGSLSVLKLKFSSDYSKFKPAGFFAGELEEPKFLWCASGVLLDGAITGMEG